MVLRMPECELYYGVSIKCAGLVFKSSVSCSNYYSYVCAYQGLAS